MRVRRHHGGCLLVCASASVRVSVGVSASVRVSVGVSASVRVSVSDRVRARVGTVVCWPEIVLAEVREQIPA